MLIAFSLTTPITAHSTPTHVVRAAQLPTVELFEAVLQRALTPGTQSEVALVRLLHGHTPESIVAAASRIEQIIQRTEEDK